MSERAPWRRAARPLAILFCAQLSGIGCAARTVEIAPPTQPSEIEPYLQVYEDQLEKGGITLEEAEGYLTGRSDSLFPGDKGTGAADLATFASTDPDLEAGLAGQLLSGSETTYRIVDGVAEYRIGPGDVLAITTFLGPETPTPRTYRVGADGKIFIARFNIGAVHAAGAGPTELSRTVTDLYRQYVPAGYAEVRVQDYNAWSASLMGEIVLAQGVGPGIWPLQGRVTASEFIVGHGGPTADGDMSNVRIVREGVETRVNLISVIEGRGGDDPPINAGDIVFVPSIASGPSASAIFLLGEVYQPGVHNYIEGASVLDAIARAGGYTSTAGTDKVFLTRPSTGEVIPVDLGVYLGEGQAASAPVVHAGDFIVVPFRDRNFSERLRDWVAVMSLIISAATIWAIFKQ